MSWQGYTVFLLESIGIYNRDLMMHYYKKIKKFMIWYKCKHQTDLKDIPEIADNKLESQKKAISWRRIARAIEKNDFYLRRLSFAQTKNDDKELKRLIHKWDNLLDKTTLTDDTVLQSFINRGRIKMVIKITNKDEKFYEYMGKFFGSRLVEKITKDRIYDDNDKEWYVYLEDDKVMAFVSISENIVKNIYTKKDKYLEEILKIIKKECNITYSIVTNCYNGIYENSGFKVSKNESYKNFVTIYLE